MIDCDVANVEHNRDGQTGEPIICTRDVKARN